MDCVRTAVRQGAVSVRCLYSRDRLNMPGARRETAHAGEEGVEFVWLSIPMGVTGDGTVRGVKVARMFLGAPDATGRQTPEEIPGAETLMKADLVIKAPGFEPENLPERWDRSALDVTRRGTVRTSFRTHATSLEGVYAAGDIVHGASLVVWAIRDGREAAESIMAHLASRTPAWRPRSSWPAIRRGTGTMAMIGAAWAGKHAAERDRVARTGMYDPGTEHSSCGGGFVVRVDGEPRRRVFELGIQALQAVWHRGAVDADGKSGDGAGIFVELPYRFIQERIRRTGHEPSEGELFAVGQVFLPRNGFTARETCRTIVESEDLRMGYDLYGWRQVPVDMSCLGERANATRPEIEQILISNHRNTDEEQFERELQVIRRRIEKAVTANHVNGFYICSLSCRSVIYKGMMLAEQVAAFYPDLMDPDFVSASAIYHQRHSTNTFPQWWLAQPSRMLAHNGEINTLKGNMNWMKSHEIRMASSNFGSFAEDIKPVIAAGSSDSAALDSVFEVLVQAGRPAPMAKVILVPESWSHFTSEVPESWQHMYACNDSIMEPWDGPAAPAMTDGRRV